MGRKSPQQTAEHRERILSKATALFGKKGFGSVTFQHLADALGVSQPSIFYHFKDREALVDAVIARMVELNHATVSEAVEALGPHADALSRLERHLLGNLDWGLKHRPEASLLLLLFYLSSLSAKQEVDAELLMERGRARILDCLQAAQRESSLAVRGSPKDLARILHTFLIGGFTLQLISGDPERARKEILRGWHALLEPHVARPR